MITMNLVGFSANLNSFNVLVIFLVSLFNVSLACVGWMDVVWGDGVLWFSCSWGSCFLGVRVVHITGLEPLVSMGFGLIFEYWCPLMLGAAGPMVWREVWSLGGKAVTSGFQCGCSLTADLSIVIFEFMCLVDNVGALLFPPLDTGKLMLCFFALLMGWWYFGSTVVGYILMNLWHGVWQLRFEFRMWWINDCCFDYFVCVY